MGRSDTDRPNNTPNNGDISPNRNLDHPGPDDDSDNEFEQYDDNDMGNYMPLSQMPEDEDGFHSLNTNFENENDQSEEVTELAERAVSSEPIDIPVPLLKDSSTELVEQVWSQPPPKELDIELTEKKIDLVKQVMSNIQLPFEAIPDWAKNIPEDEWKTNLLKKIHKTDKHL